ncbi:MAG TPA: hypothetical protein VFI09_04180 [Solirubrobacterales bacterium]|nr:hypothetical protein [Solirubrobacterales bacterium]
MDGRAQQPEDFATAFESAFARLQVLLETACAGPGPWSRRAALAVRGTLELAGEDPDSARVLTNDALAEGVDGVERYERLMTYVAGLLEGGRAQSPHGDELPPTTERTIAGGVATIIANRLGRARQGDLLELTPELVQFVLTPYMGTEEAKRLATDHGWPRSQPGR